MKILRLPKQKSHNIKLKLLTILIVMLVASHSYAETTNFGELLTGVRTVVRKFGLASAIANMQSMETSTGSIGAFPHFGLGFSQTFTMTGAVDFFTLTDSSEFNYSTIPGFGGAVNYNLRIGGPQFGKNGFPYELGVYVGSMNANNFIAKNFTSSDLSFELLNLGFILRVPFFQEQRFVPGMTMGLTYGYTKADVEFPYFIPLSYFIVKEEEGVTTSMFIDSTSLEYSMHTNTIGLNFHVSKLLLFFEPMMSISPTVSFVNIDARVNARNIGVHIYRDDGEILGELIPYDQYKQAYGELFDDIEVTSNGISLADGTIYGGVNLTTGFGLRVWKFYFDMLFSYEPFSNSTSFKIGSSFNY